MEALVRTSSSSSSATYLLSSISKINGGVAVTAYQKPCLISATGFSSPRRDSGTGNKLFLPSRVGKSVIVEAKKNRNKVDKHSFVPKPDEATGPFPEAVLLKERKIQEDGKLLPEFADAEEAKLFEFLQLQMESDLNIEQMRHYEVVYLIHENHAEEVVSVKEKVQEFLREKKGKIWRLNDWGLRRLAYKIKKAKNAYYILMNFELEAKWINDFKSMLDKDERVIRHLVMKRDEAETKDCPPPPEFHTLQAGMDDEDETNYDGIDVEDDIIVVDDDNNDIKDEQSSPSGISIRSKPST